MIRIIYSKKFEVKLGKIIRGKNKLLRKVINKIDKFQEDPKYPSLKTHKLTGKMDEIWSFWIEGDLRIIYYWEEDGSVVFADIGTHDEVYKK